MERLLFTQLEKWKDKKKRKPLIIQGARQVGKTWIMKEFGKRYFENVVYINFENNERMKNVFEADFDISRIISALKIEHGSSFEAEKTLLIFDEIQEVPKALTSLKYFYENAPEYAIVAAGSLLGVAMHQGTSFPVGKVEFLHLYPLNFYEFLLAIGETALAQLLQQQDLMKNKLSQSKLHQMMFPFSSLLICRLVLALYLNLLKILVLRFPSFRLLDVLRNGCLKRLYPSVTT